MKGALAEQKDHQWVETETMELLRGMEENRMAQRERSLFFHLLSCPLKLIAYTLPAYKRIIVVTHCRFIGDDFFETVF